MEENPPWDGFIPGGMSEEKKNLFVCLSVLKIIIVIN